MSFAGEYMRSGRIRTHPFPRRSSDFPSYLPAEALAEQVRHLDENRATVAAKSGNNLSREGMCFRVVEVIVVADVKRGAGAGGPARKELSTHARAQCVVVNYGACKGGASELISATESQNVNVERGSLRVSSL